MAFFDSIIRQHEGITLSGIPFVFRDIFVADTDNLIKDLQNPAKQAQAFQNFAKSLLISVGGESPKSIQHFLAEDLAGMLLDMRAASLGDVFEFKYEAPGCKKEDFSVNISSFAKKPYCFAGVCRYGTYNEMLAGERERHSLIAGKPFRWYLPFASAKVNEFDGLLAGAASLRNAVYDEKTPNGDTIPAKINWPDAPQFLLDQFAAIWKADEGKIDSTFSITTSDGKSHTLNAVSLPGFFSAVLAQ